MKARRVHFYGNRDRRLPRRAFEGSRVHGECQAVALKRLIQDLAQLVRGLRCACAPTAALAFALLPQPFFGALQPRRDITLSRRDTKPGALCPHFDLVKTSI